LIDLIRLAQHSFWWMLQTSKSFKLSNFSTPRSHARIARVVKIERYLFHRK
jgi:hypothetical protein